MSIDPSDYEVSKLASEQRRDIGTIRAFWEQYPDELVELRILRGPEPRLSILIWSRDHDERIADLRTRLLHGDTLDVNFARFPMSLLREIQDSVRQMWQEEPLGRFRQMGQQRDTIHIALRADQEALAAALRTTYGDAVELTVGNFTFPLNLEPRGDDLERHAVTSDSDEVSFPDLQITLQLDSPTVVAGMDGQGTVVLRNVGTTAIAFDSGEPLVGSIVRPMSNDAVGGFCGAIAGVGRRIHLAPGDEATLGFIFGTASSIRAMGYCVAPGDYVVKVRIPVWETSPEPHPSRRRVMDAPPVPLLIVES